VHKLKQHHTNGRLSHARKQEDDNKFWDVLNPGGEGAPQPPSPLETTDSMTTTVHEDEDAEVIVTIHSASG
jgi:hypothetical protein